MTFETNPHAGHETEKRRSIAVAGIVRHVRDEEDLTASDVKYVTYCHDCGRVIDR